MTKPFNFIKPSYLWGKGEFGIHLTTWNYCEVTDQSCSSYLWWCCKTLGEFTENIFKSLLDNICSSFLTYWQSTAKTDDLLQTQFEEILSSFIDWFGRTRETGEKVEEGVNCISVETEVGEVDYKGTRNKDRALRNTITEWRLKIGMWFTAKCTVVIIPFDADLFGRIERMVVSKLP